MRPTLNKNYFDSSQDLRHKMLANPKTDITIYATIFANYYPLALIIVGTICNTITFVILNRLAYRNKNERPTLHYMRAIAIVDTVMLYGWNLDHYLLGVHGYALQTYSIPSCKIFTFLNYFTCQTSVWLRVFVCLDQYLAMSRLHRTWFGRSKNVLIIIGCIFIVFLLFNIHIVIFGCHYDTDGSVNVNSYLYDIEPLWMQINLFIYNYIPFLLMFILNGMVIHQLIARKRTRVIANSRVSHRSISITLVITTFLLIIMTLPVNIAFGYFSESASQLLFSLLDEAAYTYHSLPIVNYLITFTEFRKEFIRMILRKNLRRIEPVGTNAQQHDFSTTNGHENPRVAVIFKAD